ncbi:MAG: hypothetical protein A3C79_00480 [Candidatus Taylorbacteria bacterium RIFCSPHIGHO2_02_FULL_45_28]|nr:MAG: hypothetical protein A3C79_00480 [Candidatus Taylorbacteria bacterium RIFCSPHIGHO2_02_FULL_45_28]OHA44964.1 MAG: hypothetical protein A3G04_00815 [Candidatus Taylorbacteria bacterium RIFCSPLOWO2_12_FULL_44_9]
MIIGIKNKEDQKVNRNRQDKYEQNYSNIGDIRDCLDGYLFPADSEWSDELCGSILHSQVQHATGGTTNRSDQQGWEDQYP